SAATASLKSSSSEVTVTRTANSWRRRRRRRSPACGGGSAGSTAGIGRTAATGAGAAGAVLRRVRRADMCLLTVAQGVQARHHARVPCNVLTSLPFDEDHAPIGGQFLSTS